MKTIRTLIVDDEPLARDGIAVMLEADPDFEIIGQCADGRSALEAIRRARPDLVFLDIQMQGLDGLQVLEKLPADERPAVIFVTAYDKFAVQAFDVCAIDYVLKPFRDARFRSAVDRARERIRRADWREMRRRIDSVFEQLGRMGGESAPASASRIGFKIGSRHLFFPPADIVWIEAQGDHVRMAAGDQTHVVRESLQSVERRLDASQFVRVQRSFIVNLERVRQVAPALYGDHDLIMSDGVRIRISRGSRGKLRALFPVGQD
jgi:two-component system LytT family response regulator